MKVLGIETSCDESAAAIYCDKDGLLSHKVYSQTVHSEHGGVVPELAARDHIRKTLGLIEDALSEAKCSKDDVDAIAYTAGPGLAGALLVGSMMGKTIAYAWNKPSIAVNHMEGHLLAPMLEDSAPKPPFVALIVSGGHTMLVDVQQIGEYRLLGETVDDAAGEAFDKVARLLNLGKYTGSEVAKIAELGDKKRFKFPRPMTKTRNLDFSFSGLKTKVLYEYQSIENPVEQDKADIAWAFQEAVIETLVKKCKLALQDTRLNALVLAGGVGANKYLRQRLAEELGDNSVFYPRIEFCTDNAAMIAYAGWWNLSQGRKDLSLAVKVKPRWKLV